MADTVVIVQEPIYTTSITDDAVSVSVDLESMSVVVPGTPGPQGPKGDPGDETLGEFECGEAIPSSSLIHVAADGFAYKADSSLNRPATGYSISGAAQGHMIDVVREGVLDGLSGKTRGVQQWLGTGGLSSETPPVDGVVQLVGVALSEDSISVSIGQVFKLLL